MNPLKPTTSSLTLPIIAGLAGFFVSIVCFAGIGFAGWTALQSSNQVTRLQLPPLTPENLVVSSASLSEQWEIRDAAPDRETDNTTLAYDAATVKVEHFNTLAQMQNLRSSGTQTVYRYNSLSDAHRDYLQHAAQWFESDDYTEWVTPPAVTTPSEVADEHHFGCALEITSDRVICVMVARYSQYVSEFQLYLGNSNLSDAEIQNVLTALDQPFIEMGVKE